MFVMEENKIITDRVEPNSARYYKINIKEINHTGILSVRASSNARLTVLYSAATFIPYEGDQNTKNVSGD